MNSDSQSTGWPSASGFQQPFGEKFKRKMAEFLERAQQMEYEPGVLDGTIKGPMYYNRAEFYRTATPEEVITARFNDAGFPLSLRHATFANFRTPTDSHQAVVEGVERWVGGFKSRLGLNRCHLILWGDCGLGKSHLAVSAAKEIVLMNGYPVAFADCVDMMSKLRGSYTDEPLEEYCKNNLLIIDDLGAEQGTNVQVEKLVVILRRRMNDQLPTIITTNLLYPKGMGDRKGISDYLSSRTTSRMEECFEDILFANMRDYRHNLSLIERQKAKEEGRMQR